MTIEFQRGTLSFDTTTGALDAESIPTVTVDGNVYGQRVEHSAYGDGVFLSEKNPDGTISYTVIFDNAFCCIEDALSYALLGWKDGNGPGTPESD